MYTSASGLKVLNMLGHLVSSVDQFHSLLIFCLNGCFFKINN